MPKDLISRDSVTGRQKVVKSVTVSTGAGDASKIVELDGAGKIDKSALPTTVAGGTAAQSGKVPELNGAGKIDLSLLPDNVGPESMIVVAGEALSANNIVAIDSTGKAVKAVSTNIAKMAVGYVKTAVANGANAEVFFGNINAGYAGLTPGQPVYLSQNAGDPKSTVPVAGTDTFAQIVGTAVSNSAILFEVAGIIEL
ncbi:hypothetical protein GOQ04_21810 [Emticicia sp. ODNR4P]|nr:hypothetical protein [Emticicia sp. ODNR4P]